MNDQRWRVTHNKLYAINPLHGCQDIRIYPELEFFLICSISNEGVSGDKTLSDEKLDSQHAREKHQQLSGLRISIMLQRSVGFYIEGII